MGEGNKGGKEGKVLAKEHEWMTHGHGWQGEDWQQEWGGRMGWEESKGGNWDNCHRTIIKYSIKKRKASLSGFLPNKAENHWPTHQLLLQSSRLPGYSSAAATQQGPPIVAEWINVTGRLLRSRNNLPKAPYSQASVFQALNVNGPHRRNVDNMFPTPSPLPLKSKAFTCEKGCSPGLSGDEMSLHSGTRPRRKCGIPLLDPPLEC